MRRTDTSHLPRCPRCGGRPEYSGLYSVFVNCSECYDGAPDAGPQVVATGRTRDDADEDWGRVVEEYEDRSWGEARAEGAVDPYLGRYRP